MIFVGTVFGSLFPFHFVWLPAPLSPLRHGAMGYLSRIASRSKGVAVFFMNQFGTGSAFHGHCINLECTLYDKKISFPENCWSQAIAGSRGIAD